MDVIIYIALAAVIGAALGFGLCKLMLNKGFLKEKKDLEAREADVQERERKQQEEADMILKQAKIDAENIKKERIYEAKEKYLKLKSDFEEETTKKKNEITNTQNQLKEREKELEKKEQDIKQKENQIEEEKEDIKTQRELVEKKQSELDKIKEQQVELLEKTSGLSAEEAKEQLMETLRAEAETQAASHIKDTMEEAKLTATKEAKKVVIETIQRTATEHAIENCVSVFNIESDDIKGKIIGREGRNIRALESATGVEIIVDDTPEAIIISGFDPVRREIARLSLHRLVSDGRIHPARIEEVVAKTTKNIEEEIVELGERTVIDLGIHGMHPELIKLVGRMRYRSSYGQNLLQHSRETAKLCATMASELGLNSKLAKRAGLLHDIGKVWPDEPEKPHAILGEELAKKYKENDEVCNAIGAHHDEIEMTSLISPIVQACDAISGSRPGARREIVESYLQRLRDLEALAGEFDGVNKCYAIQAGRELRVMVDAERINDQDAGMLSYNISQKIEKNMQYPGQIKVTVIREMRSVNFAK